MSGIWFFSSRRKIHKISIRIAVAIFLIDLLSITITVIRKLELVVLKSTLKPITEFTINREIEKSNGVLNIPRREKAKLRKKMIKGATKELRTELLKDDGMQVIVVSAPGGAGKTALIKKLCADDQVKGAAIPSPSSPIPQVPAKPESLPMNYQWQKGKLIGKGSYGRVYVASNRETGALCAMKEVEMLPDDPKSAECIKQLEQEIKVLSNLKHPNIVQYYGSEIVEDKFYIYMEYVHPGSINKYIREYCGPCKAMTESIVRNFTCHILSGLAYLHSKRTIHRDIKGANLLVDASGVVKLADFGMAKHLTGQAADLSLKGSPYWMAPELMISVMQRDNNSDLALAVDIWSLGCTIIEMYTGKPPWSEFEGAAAMFKVMKDTPSIPESLSAEGKDFLRCCFRRNPADRPLASKLLEHRFLKNSQRQPDVLSSYRQSFSGMKLIDKLHSPREQSESKLAPLAISPSPSTKKKVFESFMHYSFSPVRDNNNPSLKLPT